jgi:hypothetical protein
MSNIWGTWQQDVGPQSFGQPHPYSLAVYSQLGLAPELAVLIACSVLGQTFLAFPTSCGLHCSFSLTLTASSSPPQSGVSFRVSNPFMQCLTSKAFL